MGKAAYPTDADLVAFLAEAGVTIASASVRSAAVAAGISAFEKKTGRHMLAGKTTANEAEAEATRYFDVPSTPDGILWLGPWNDLAVPATSSPVVYFPQGNTAGEAWPATDWFFAPRNYPAIGKPYDRLMLLRRFWSPIFWNLQNAIRITGLWGYSTSIPDDAWLAMLQSAALHIEGQYRLSSTGGRTGFSVTGGVSVQFGIESYTNIVKGWQDKVDMAVASYRRIEA